MDQNKEEIDLTPNEVTCQPEATRSSDQTTTKAPNFYGQTPPFMPQAPQTQQYDQQPQYPQNAQSSPFQNNVTWQNGIPPMPPVQTLSSGKGYSISSLILGIISVVTSGGILSFITSILAIVFGIVGRKKSKAVLGKSSGLATAGFILGIIGISLTLLYFACSIALDMMLELEGDYGDYDY